MLQPSGRPTRRRNDSGKPPSWRERIEALRYVPPLLKLVWETHHGYTIGMVLLRLVRAFVPVAALWIGKQIIDEVIAQAGGAHTLGEIWRLVAIEMGIVLAGDLLGRASALIESLLGDLFSNHTSVRLMEHAA